MSAAQTDDGQTTPTSNLLIPRLAIGLAHGLVLYGLTEAFPTKTLPASIAWSAAALPAMLIPVAALGGFGSMRLRTLLIWLAAAALILAGLGAYDGFARPTHENDWVSPIIIAASIAGLFIAFQLTSASLAEGRWIASYRRYFDDSSKDVVRLGLSLAFTGALWLLLLLGAALFKLIGLSFLHDLIEKPWFFAPVSTTAFALAVHMTDIQAGLVKGVRGLGLTLLSVLLPVITLLAAGFMAALPFTGLEPLWKTRSAAAILLAAAAALIILINAAYQSGETAPHRVLAWAGRIAAVLVAPMVIIAAYGIALRVGQYGLTPDRVVATGCAVVGACFAVGYFIATVRPGPWLKTVEITNLTSGYVALVVLLALFSPLADPKRLSVADQLHRLDTGKVTPAKFDYNFLGYRSGRIGERALDQLAARTQGPNAAEIAGLAKAAKAGNAPPSAAIEGASITDAAERVVVAGGGTLPDSFLGQTWADDPLGWCTGEQPACGAFVADLNKDGTAEVVIAGPNRRTVYGLSGGVWNEVGVLADSSCSAVTDGAKAGDYKILTPAWQDVEIGGIRLSVVPNTSCGVKR